MGIFWFVLKFLFVCEVEVGGWMISWRFFWKVCQTFRPTFRILFKARSAKHLFLRHKVLWSLISFVCVPHSLPLLKGWRQWRVVIHLLNSIFQISSEIENSCFLDTSFMIKARIPISLHFLPMMINCLKMFVWLDFVVSFSKHLYNSCV